jgi:HK97 family phage major capsid protein
LTRHNILKERGVIKMATKQITKEDLKAMVSDIFNEKFEDIEETNRKYVQQMLDEKVKTSKEQQKGKGTTAARWLRALAAGKGDPERAARYVKQKWEDEELAKELSESIFEDGGVLVPDEYVNEVIELLRARTAVRALGAQQLPMNSGSLTIPKINQGATASYVGEGERGHSSQPAFGSLQLSAKKLKSLVPISNDLLRDGAPQIDSIVRDDMVTSIKLREDLAFIRGAGTENTPKGMYYWALPGNKNERTLDSAAVTLGTVTNDLMQMMLLLEQADVPMTRCGWIMSPRSAYFLRKLRVNDNNGAYAFKDEMQKGTLLGFAFQTTSQIPNNLDFSTAGTNDESEIYFADFAQLIIGENTSMIIDVSDQASFWDGSRMRSAFDEDLTLMRAITRHDFGSRYDQAISVLEGVDWKFAG